MAYIDYEASLDREIHFSVLVDANLLKRIEETISQFLKNDMKSQHTWRVEFSDSFTYRLSNSSEITDLVGVGSGRVLKSINYIYRGDYTSKIVHSIRINMNKVYSESGQISVSLEGVASEVSALASKLEVILREGEPDYHTLNIFLGKIIQLLALLAGPILAFFLDREEKKPLSVTDLISVSLLLSFIFTIVIVGFRTLLNKLLCRKVWFLIGPEARIYQTRRIIFLLLLTLIALPLIINKIS
jgi:hypothetical protein